MRGILRLLCGAGNKSVNPLHDALGERDRLLDGGMVRPNWSQPQNTTISAIITLSIVKPHYQLLVEMIRADRNREITDCEAELERSITDYDPRREIPRVIVWHNTFARMPFPNDLFCGPYDTHFGIVHGETGEVAQSVTYRGSALPESITV